MNLVINNLKKNFEKKEVLKDITFTFEKGKIYGLLGRNGAGKTTLFNALANEFEVDGGEMFLIDEKGNKETLSSENIGYVISTPVVPEFLTGREFLRFFIEINQHKIKNLKTIDEYFDFLNIEVEDRDRIMKDYSHGMKNKMQMLVNIIANPEVLLLDEPLTSFDVVVADEMKKMLRKIKKDHILIFSTHILELATDLCDEIVILHNGVLESVQNEDLNSAEFKEKIIDILKDENHD